MVCIERYCNSLQYKYSDASLGVKEIKITDLRVLKEKATLVINGDTFLK